MPLTAGVRKSVLSSTNINLSSITIMFISSKILQNGFKSFTELRMFLNEFCSAKAAFFRCIQNVSLGCTRLPSLYVYKLLQSNLIIA